MKNSLFSAVEFLIVVVVLMSGGFLMALPWAPAARFKLATFFAEQESFFLLLGAVIFFIGLILLIGFYSMNRKRFFQVEMKASEKQTLESIGKPHEGSIASFATSSLVAEDLILSILSVYWKALFPREELMTNVFIHRDQKIELIAEIPKLEEETQKVLLEKVEKEIGALLSRQIGYEKDFLLTIVVK